MRIPRLLAVIPVALVCLVALAPGAGAKSTPADVQRGLEGLVDAPGGPPGAIATIYRDGELTVAARRPRRHQAQGRAAGDRPHADRQRRQGVQRRRRAQPRPRRQARPRRHDRPAAAGMPAAWGAVTVRQLLNHTSGLPDYTQSKAFAKQATNGPPRLRLAADSHRLGPRRPARVRARLEATSTRTPTTSSSA